MKAEHIIWEVMSFLKLIGVANTIAKAQLEGDLDSIVAPFLNSPSLRRREAL